MYLLATVWHQFSQILICASCTLGQGDFTLISHHHHLSSSSISAQCRIHCALGMRRNPSGFVSDCLSALLLSVSDWCIRSLVHKHTHERYTHIHTQIETCIHIQSWAIFLWKITMIMAQILIQESLWRFLICFVHKTLVSGHLRSDSSGPCMSGNILLKDGLTLWHINSSTVIWGIENRHSIDETCTPSTAPYNPLYLFFF